MRTSAASEHRLDRLVSRHWWVIDVAGYGPFAFYGTENEAEEMRAHKAAWEGGAGTKKRATTRNEIVRRQIRWVLDYEIPKGYARSEERERAETEACLAANG